jgi:restriction endonuclease Mrr
MKPGPALAANLFFEIVRVTDAPRDAMEWLVRICLMQEWARNDIEAQEMCSRWVEPFLAQLRQKLREFRRLGRFEPFAFNSSSEYMVQGPAFIEPADTKEQKEQKKRITHFDAYVTALRNLSARKFEALCSGLVHKLGVANPVLTKSSFDEGIDFYGKLDLEQFIRPMGKAVGVEKQLSVWIIGQAKHYKKQKVSTFDVRDLVGAVELAKGKSFGSTAPKYGDLNVRVCDPVFYFFVTTGKLSGPTWNLLERGGIVGMDGHMVAAFLAGHKVGIKLDKFDEPTFDNWIDSYLSPETKEAAAGEAS